MPTEINPISSADMHAQFEDALAYWFRVAEISGLHLTQSHSNPRLCDLVADGMEPFREGLTTVLALVSKEFDHRAIVT